MTCLPSPSFYFSSEISSPFDLDSGLKVCLQSASFFLSTLDSATWRVGVPSLLPSLADEGLVSPFTERVFWGSVTIVMRFSWRNQVSQKLKSNILCE